MALSRCLRLLQQHRLSINCVKTIPLFQSSIPIHKRTASYYRFVFLERRNSNLPIDLDLVNDVVSCYCASYQVDHAFSVLAIMFKLGVNPNEFTFHSLLTGLVSVNKHLDADILLHKLIRLKLIQPDIATYDSLIKGVEYAEKNKCQCNNTSFSKSVGLITYAKLLIGYDGLIVGMCKWPQYTSAAIELLGEMVSIPLTPSVNTYNAILQILFYQASYCDALPLFLEMKDKGVPVHSFTYAVIIDRFCKDGLSRDALRFLAHMEADHHFVAIHVYNTVLNHLFSAGEVDQAVMFFDRVLDLHHLQPNAATYAQMLLGFTSQGLWDEALDLLPEIESNDNLPREFKLACQNYFNNSQTIQPVSAYPANTSTISIFRDLPSTKQMEQL